MADLQILFLRAKFQLHPSYACIHQSLHVGKCVSKFAENWRNPLLFTYFSAAYWERNLFTITEAMNRTFFLFNRLGVYRSVSQSPVSFIYIDFNILLIQWCSMGYNGSYVPPAFKKDVPPSNAIHHYSCNPQNYGFPIRNDCESLSKGRYTTWLFTPFCYTYKYQP